MIKKVKGGWCIVSKTTGRKLSKVYKSKDSPELKKRMREIEYFKKK
jgi:hypothetical protein